MVGINVTGILPHGLYPEYTKSTWSVMADSSRNQEMLAVEYLPYLP